MDRTEAIFASLAAERKAKRADQSAVKAKQLLERCFLEQRAFIEDPHTRKSLLCASRAGKSFTCAVYILYVLLTVKRANILYIAFIRSQAEEIIWQQLKNLNDEFQLGLKFGEAELTVTDGKGGWARIKGCESWGDVDKQRGVPRHLVILDEAQIWIGALLKNLINDVIEPRLGDYKGTLVITGTPGPILNGPFYDATGPTATSPAQLEDGTWRAESRAYTDRANPRWDEVVWKWSLHGWPKSANTSKEGQSAWAEALEMKRNNGWSDDNPTWVREHLGRWMADDSKLVFRYEPARNNWLPKDAERTADNPFALPAGHYWRYVISCDMGFHDPFALQVGAFSDTHPDLFQVYEYEATKLTVAGVADAIKKVLELVDSHDVEAMVADLQGLGGMVVETLGQEYGFWFEKLEQRDKRDHVELFNSGLVDRRIWVMVGSRLADEMLYLAWDATGLKTRPNQANHNCDAFLGVVRHSRHLEARAVTPGPKPGTPEFHAARETEERRAIGKKQLKAARGGEPNDETFFSER